MKRVVHVFSGITGEIIATTFGNPGAVKQDWEGKTVRLIDHLPGTECSICDKEKQKEKRTWSDEKEDPWSFSALGAMVGELVDKKNAAYGNSFAKCGEFLRLLYPDGVRPDQYDDMLCLVRIFDKMMRIANQKDAFDESPFQDIAGYGLLGLKKDASK